MKRKILVIADSFLPGYKGGGPVTSITNFSLMLGDTFDIVVLTRNHDYGDSTPYKNVQSDTIVQKDNYAIYYAATLNMKLLRNLISEIAPDIIYLNSFFSTLTQKVMLINQLYFHSKILLAPRGELQENALKIKWLKKHIYLTFYKILGLYKKVYFHATDPIEAKRIKSLFHVNQIVTLQNPVLFHLFSPLTKNRDELRLVFVSRISRKKNLDFALQLLKNVEFTMIFDIYGPMEDNQYWQECLKIIESLPQNIIVKYQGTLKPIDIKEKLREYHGFFFPTKSENFGHVIVEAMQCGLVPIISDQTPWQNLQECGVGWSITLKDSLAYIHALKILYGMDKKEYLETSQAVISYIHEKLDMSILKKAYIDFLNDFMKI